MWLGPWQQLNICCSGRQQCVQQHYHLKIWKHDEKTHYSLLWSLFPACAASSPGHQDENQGILWKLRSNTRVVTHIGFISLLNYNQSPNMFIITIIQYLLRWSWFILFFLVQLQVHVEIWSWTMCAVSELSSLNINQIRDLFTFWLNRRMTKAERGGNERKKNGKWGVKSWVRETETDGKVKKWNNLYN